MTTKYGQARCSHENCQEPPISVPGVVDLFCFFHGRREGIVVNKPVKTTVKPVTTPVVTIKPVTIKPVVAVKPVVVAKVVKPVVAKVVKPVVATGTVVEAKGPNGSVRYLLNGKYIGKALAMELMAKN